MVLLFHTLARSKPEVLDKCQLVNPSLMQTQDRSIVILGCKGECGLGKSITVYAILGSSATFDRSASFSTGPSTRRCLKKGITSITTMLRPISAP